MDFAIVALQLPEVIKRLSSETLADPRSARWWRVLDGLTKGGRFSRQTDSIRQSGGITLLSFFDWLMSCYSRATDDPADDLRWDRSVRGRPRSPRYRTVAIDDTARTCVGLFGR